MGAPRSAPWLRLGRALIILGLATGLGALLLPRMLSAIGTFLVVEDELAPADLIFLLNGDPARRAAGAARLYQEGWANRIVLTEAEGDLLVELGLRQSSSQLAHALLESLGVPAAQITLLPVAGGATSTRDEARALATYLQGHPAEEILVVTSEYHTRRTRWTLRRILPRETARLRLVPIPAGVPPAEWWTREESFLLYLEEYLKFVHGWMSS